MGTSGEGGFGSGGSSHFSNSIDVVIQPAEVVRHQGVSSSGGHVENSVHNHPNLHPTGCDILLVCLFLLRDIIAQIYHW